MGFFFFCSLPPPTPRPRAHPWALPPLVVVWSISSFLEPSRADCASSLPRGYGGYGGGPAAGGAILGCRASCPAPRPVVPPKKIYNPETSNLTTSYPRPVPTPKSILFRRRKKNVWLSHRRLAAATVPLWFVARASAGSSKSPYLRRSKTKFGVKG